MHSLARLKMNDENFEDYAITKVKELRDNGELIASFFLCSSFVEHYSKTRLFSFIIGIRKMELVTVQNKVTKEPKTVFIVSKLKKIVWKMGQYRTIETGLLVGAWNHELYIQLKKFNKKRLGIVHEYENILNKDEEKVKNVIDLGLSLLYNLKLGYVQTEPKSHDK
jgi:hypothetical protein